MHNYEILLKIKFRVLQNENEEEDVIRSSQQAKTTFLDKVKNRKNFENDCKKLRHGNSIQEANQENRRRAFGNRKYTQRPVFMSDEVEQPT